MKESAAERARTRYTFFVSFVAAMGGFLFGYDLAIILGAQIFLRDQFSLSPGAFGFAVSSAMLGCLLGPSLGARLCDKLGRKSTLMGAGILFAVGAVGTALATHIAVFNLFRIGGGIGVGLASIASPMYIAEIAPARRRGSLGLMYQLAIVVGSSASIIVAYFLARYVTPTLSWRLMFISVLLPIACFMILLIKVPQGPRWLAAQGRFDEAAQILIKINGEDQARGELQEIKNSLAGETGTFGELFQPGMRNALFVGIVLAVVNQWTGWCGIAIYMPTLFQESGYPQASAAIGENALVFIGTIFLTFVSIYLVDRTGRRPLWLGSSAAMFFCLVVAGWVFQIHIKGPVAVAAIFLCAIPHTVGLGPLPWLMMSEIYPTRIRARAVSITTTFLWIAGFTAPFVFPILEATSKKALGSAAGVFWFYAVICVITFFWAFKYLPETKGRTLEEIAGSWLVGHAKADLT